MSELAELLKRVETASGPDTDLDEALTAFAAGAERVDDATFDHKPGYTRGGSWVSIGPVVPLTASIDAALALVERKLPGIWWVLAKGRMTASEPLFGCELLFGSDEQIAIAAGHSQALAILAALLRALLHEGQG